MSIADEITRIKNAKTSIKIAIENKGVEVGDGTIDTYASKINEIASGEATVFIEEYYLEGTKLNILLSNGQTLAIDISEYIGAGFTVEKIEELIVSNLENKTIEEVEN